jgi:hypothetical protein
MTLSSDDKAQNRPAITTSIATSVVVRKLTSPESRPKPESM